MPKNKKTDSPNSWGILAHLREKTRPFEIKDRREYGGFVMCWERDKAPNFDKLKNLTKEYLLRNSKSFQYAGCDVIEEGFQACEAICTGYAGYYFKFPFSDVETKINLARYDNHNGIFIKFFENWRIKTDFPFLF